MFNVVALKRINVNMIKNKTIERQVFCWLHLVCESLGFRFIGEVMSVRGSVM